MCGIIGFVDFSQKSDEGQLIGMVEKLRHRGPDASGTLVLKNDNGVIGLGHTRLSIIDLSSTGHQPMEFANLCMVYNGEIYNFTEIRKELEGFGYSFHGHSDSEVILKSYHKWGVSCVDRFIGMFAIVVFDKEKEELTLIRDRAGVKPLYLYQTDDLILFGSELKALMAHPRFKKYIDHDVIPEYLHYGYIPGALSIFKNTEKVKPGCMVTFKMRTKSRVDKQYWDITEFYRKPKFTGTYEEAKHQLKELLSSAYSYRMVSDVPVGVFLSGGYDSTSVAAILSSERKEKLNTFTIGFYQGNNEAPQAREIAELLGTNHFELFCTKAEAKAVILKLPEIYDEPFADSSAIPTTLVSQMARRHVTVALSADGGDEQFFGYGHYFTQYKNFRRIEHPWFRFFSPPKINYAAEVLTTCLPLRTQKKYQISAALEVLRENTKVSRAHSLFWKSQRKPTEYISKLLLNSLGLRNGIKKEAVVAGLQYPEDIFSWLDFKQYLPDDILTKVDRATMSVSLEGREPLLDHRVAEFAASLPLEFKYSGGSNGKRILKDIVHEYVPKKIMDQPKRGFTIPVLHWLKSDLKHLLDEYLSEEALEKTKTFKPDFVMKELKAFLDDKMHYKPIIWYILMYQMWYFKWLVND